MFPCFLGGCVFGERFHYNTFLVSNRIVGFGFSQMWKKSVMVAGSVVIAVLKKAVPAVKKNCDNYHEKAVPAIRKNYLLWAEANEVKRVILDC